MITALWVLLAVVVLGGAVLVLRVLARVAAAARELQRNVAILSQHVASSIQHMGGDVQALGETVDDLRRRSAESVPDGAASMPERTEGP